MGVEETEINIPGTHALVWPYLKSFSSNWIAEITFSVAILASTKPLGIAVGARMAYLLGKGFHRYYLIGYQK